MGRGYNGGAADVAASWVADNYSHQASLVGYAPAPASIDPSDR